MDSDGRVGFCLFAGYTVWEVLGWGCNRRVDESRNDLQGDLQMQRAGSLVRMHCVLLPDRLSRDTQPCVT
eukprot:804104-Amphidinium_carterae.1